MNTVKFALEENANGEMVGVGYKLMYTYEVKVNKRWKKARHINGDIYKTIGYGKRKYPFGFHIFLNQKDAENYTAKNPGKALYKVEFKNVVAFGTNYTNLNGKSGPCIIARDMRYMEIIQEY